VPACLRRDTLHFVAGLLRNGAVGKLARPQDS
jgi:hypothetical protein